MALYFGSDKYKGNMCIIKKGSFLNIAYGETAPEDTSKLWIRGNKPDKLLVCSDVENEYSINNVSSLSFEGQEIGCARVGNKIYLFGGYTSSYSDAISVFDIETQNLTTLSVKLPVPLAYMGCANVGTKIYLFGGYNNSGYQNAVYAFDTQTQAFTNTATLPKTISNLTCVTVGKKIYTFGGYNTDNSFESSIYMLDTEEEVLYRLGTTTPFAKANIGCCAVGNKIYLFGGGAGTADSSNIYEFDVENETIKSITTNLPTIHFGIRCTRMGSDIYLFGGWAQSGVTDSIYIFNTKTKKLTQPEIKLPEKLWRFGCVGYGNKVYIFGGSGNNDVIYCFTATHELSKGNMEVEIGLLTNKFNLINADDTQMKLGVENVYMGNKSNKAELVDAFLYIDGEWVQVSFGGKWFISEESTEEPTGTYVERMYNHYGIDIIEYPYMIISTHGNHSRIEFFAERKQNSEDDLNYVFTKYRYADVDIVEGADISTIIRTHESKDNRILSTTTDNVHSSEIAAYTYYANFDYAELGYEGIGTWIKLESSVVENPFINTLTTSDGYILTDKDGLYITTKESE